MSTTLICIARRYLNPCYQGSSVYFTMNTATHSVTLPAIARTLCTKGSNATSDAKPFSDRQQIDQKSYGQTAKPRTTSTDLAKPFRNGEEWNHAVRDRKYGSSTVQHKPSFTKSVFAAGTAKRTAEVMKRKAALVSLDENQGDELPKGRQRQGAERNYQLPDQPLSASEWRNLKEASYNPQRYDIHVMAALLHSGAQLDVAKSLLTFVAAETGTLSYELLLRYLTLCVSGGHSEEISDVYEIMRGCFPALDTGGSTLFIKGFSRTHRWRESISILQDLKKAFIPSPRNYGDVIDGAVFHRDPATAWAFYDEVIEQGLSPHQETWQTLFSGGVSESTEEGHKDMEEAESMTQAEYHDRLLSVLAYMRINQVYPQQSLATTIKTWFESLPEKKWRGSWTTVNPMGVCRCCGSKLESIQLTTEEYQQLKDRVMADIIQGKDVFKKTTPEELESFKEFVKKRPAFDVVVDGLNVANLTKGKQSETLLAVVSELQRQGQAVLVLGRKHMLQPSRLWDRREMKLIQQKAHCFFTENISEDDPFLLYAAIHSGNHCRFLSRDLMRDHKACLPDGPTRRLFFKWQRGHQLVVQGLITPGRRVRFQSITCYDTIVQTTGNSWHIPYDDTEDRSSYEVPQRWLCLVK